MKIQHTLFGRVKKKTTHQKQFDNAIIRMVKFSTENSSHICIHTGSILILFLFLNSNSYVHSEIYLPVFAHKIFRKKNSLTYWYKWFYERWKRSLLINAISLMFTASIFEYWRNWNKLLNIFDRIIIMYLHLSWIFPKSTESIEQP